MGAEPWSYFVPYVPDFQTALEQLREREFTAGRYNPASGYDGTYGRGLPVEERPSTIEEARELADADGTRSILDMDHVGDEADYGVAKRLSSTELQHYFGTTEPTRLDIEQAEFWEDIERGQGICCVVYENGKPRELFFAGYSYD
jgi:hypothetical protein